MGDASDGIMGVPGIGAKTAAKLLTEYGSIGAILENVDHIKGKVGQNIKDNADGIALDHQLASIVCDLDLNFGYADLKLQDPNVEALRNLYTELDSVINYNRSIIQITQITAIINKLQKQSPHRQPMKLKLKIKPRKAVLMINSVQQHTTPF